MLKHPGYKRLDAWIRTQQEGTKQYMEHEVRAVNLFTLLTLVNLFVKYLFFLQENRAYNKIRTYIAVTIAKGEQHAKQRARDAGVDRTS